MEKLLPDLLKDLWTRDGGTGAPRDALWHEQQRLLTSYRAMWDEALRLAGHAGLKDSLLAELGEYTGCGDAAEIERRCRGAVQALKEEWHRRNLDSADPLGIEAFYDRAEAQAFDLMWWHTLADDPTPLAYLVALQFAEQHGCSRHLDFGSGVGSGGIAFARHGLDVTLADISGALLRFANWRFSRRGLAATFVDLKNDRLPVARYDIVTAMDVWEHLADPVAAVDQIAETIAPGGFLFGRFAAEPDPDRPQHIVIDFEPTFQRLGERGFVEVWRDVWLWGHQVFRKAIE